MGDSSRSTLNQRTNEEQFRALLENVPDSIVRIDRDGKILYLNRIPAQFSNIKLIGRNFSELTTPQTQPLYRKAIEDVFQIGKTIYLKTSAPDQTGRIRWYESRWVPVKRGNQIETVLVIVSDVTERIEGEEKVRESEAKYRSFFESNVTAVGISDTGGNLIEVNEAWIHLFGYSRAENSALNFFSLFFDSSLREQLLPKISQDGQVQNLDIFVRRKSSEEVWVNFSIRRLKTQGVERFLIIGIDIDAKKRAEQSLQRLYETSLQISEMKSNLITFASHELKTPLVPILGWVDFLKKALTKSQIIGETETKEILETIYRSAQRLERIVDNFLDIGRIDSGRLEIQVKTHSATKLMQNALDAIADLIQSQKMRILNNIDDIALSVDGFRIEQVFINILSNAIKYSPPNKEVEITSVIERDRILISISDQGYGFTPEELQEIWQPFSASYLKKKSTTFLTGTGVGLYLSKGLVESHGGRIEIESPGKDQGTIVKIWLPLAQPPQE